MTHIPHTSYSSYLLFLLSLIPHTSYSSYLLFLIPLIPHTSYSSYLLFPIPPIPHTSYSSYLLFFISLNIHYSSHQSILHKSKPFFSWYFSLFQTLAQKLQCSLLIFGNSITFFIQFFKGRRELTALR